MRSLHDIKEEKQLRNFLVFSLCLLLIASFFMNTPEEIFQGMIQIIISRDALITDYFKLANYGAGLFNGALVFGISILLVIWNKVPLTGITLAALFINAGFALWGKNPLNTVPILIGTALYAKLHRARFSRFIYTALFGTSLAPLVTEMVYLLPFSPLLNMLAAIGVGIFIGFVLPPLAMHTASMHMGYNLFNVGFSAGILAFVLVCILKSFGLESKQVFIWQEGIHPGLMICLYGYFIGTILYGLWMNHWDFKAVWKLFRHPGRAVADFVLMDGGGSTLVNMGLIGCLCNTYILLIGGDLSGPVMGAILTAFGFAAFGAHIKNFTPVILGVFLSTFISRFQATTPTIQLAAVFAVALAPIAGQFGVIAGMIAGMLHAFIVVCTAEIYGGMNLYNNGFSAGWTAIVMIPIMESFMKHFAERKRKK